MIEQRQRPHLLLQPAPCFLSARALPWRPPRQAGRHGLETAVEAIGNMPQYQGVYRPPPSLASKMLAPLFGRFGCRVSASESVGTAVKPPGGTILGVITFGGTSMGGTNDAGIIGAGINDGE